MVRVGTPESRQMTHMCFSTWLVLPEYIREYWAQIHFLIEYIISHSSLDDLCNFETSSAMEDVALLTSLHQCKEHTTGELIWFKSQILQMKNFLPFKRPSQFLLRNKIIWEQLHLVINGLSLYDFYPFISIKSREAWIRVTQD